MINYVELLLFYLDDCSIADSLAPSACSNLVDQDNHTQFSQRNFSLPLTKMVENKVKSSRPRKIPMSGDESRDGILGHQLDKIFESFAPFYSQCLLLADLKENHTLLWL
jgi:hypothetical protein